MIRIDAVWLAVQPVDLRCGADRLLTRGAGVRGGEVAPRLSLCQRPAHAHQAGGARRLWGVVRGQAAEPGTLWPDTDAGSAAVPQLTRE